MSYGIKSQGNVDWLTLIRDETMECTKRQLWLFLFLS